MPAACRTSVGFRRHKGDSMEHATVTKCWTLAQSLHSDDTSYGTLETRWRYQSEDPTAAP